jgi:hypothetical protein
MGLLDPLSNHSNILVCDAVLAALDERDVRQRYLGWGREARAPSYGSRLYVTRTRHGRRRSGRSCVTDLDVCDEIMQPCEPSSAASFTDNNICDDNGEDGINVFGQADNEAGEER